MYEKTAQLLARNYGSLEALQQADQEELGAIHEIGPVIAESVAATSVAQTPKHCFRNCGTLG